MKPKILIIDDNVELAELICRYLNNTSYEAVVFKLDKYTTKAIVLAHMNEFDATLLDLNLGQGLDGLSILSEFRKTSQKPVLIVSGKGRSVEVVTGLNKGADDYLPKPIHMQELHARLKAVLRRHDKSAGQHVMGENDFFETLSPSQKKLYRIFLQKKTDILTREDLCAALGKEHSSRAIDTMVLRLRQKISNGGMTIITVLGKGYSLANQ